ncbi:MAG: GGDEF domain-containing protein [Candidatus Sericytochromatia bacterium]|nr:GGDEF domain-containing protein [Candidatus Sericytochromatia bacterium]
MPRPRSARAVAAPAHNPWLSLGLWTGGFVMTYGLSLAALGGAGVPEAWIPVGAGLMTATAFQFVGRRKASAAGPTPSHLKADERFCRAIDAATDTEQVASLLAGAVHQSLKPSHGYVWLYDPERREFRLTACIGLPTDHEVVPEEQFNVWFAAAAGAADLTPDEKTAASDLDHWFTRQGLTWVEPISAPGGTLGLLTLAGHADGRVYGAGDRWLVNRLVRESGMALALLMAERVDRTRRSRIDTLAQRYKDAQQRAVTDGLTGLATHVYFKEQLWQRFHEARRHSTPLSLLILDIDHFKRINDNFGHPVGDEVLRQVSKVVKEAARGYDTVARYGGEELAIALPRTDLAGATVLAERIREAVSAISPLDGRGRPVPTITASLGVAELTLKDGTPDDLIARADAALYLAKHEGRNQVRQAAGGTVTVS